MHEQDLAQIWPEWQIEKQIGRGTYGVVYQAVRQSNGLTSHAAIKVISIPQDPSELESLRSDGLDFQATRTYLKQIVDDFVNEIRLMESFKGIQNIVSIEDYKVIEKADALGWDIYIRMELLTPFSAYICDRTMTEQDVIRLGCDICTALEICGQRKIIHRDIKPENIFINSFGSFKLGDFGTARNMENLTSGLSQKGTYNYMAPEVITGNPYDSRVDVYSLGLVLYRLMNRNRLPFLSEKQLLSPSERRAAFERRIHGEELPAPCDASPALAQVILKACAFDPKDRYVNAEQLRNALIQVGIDQRDSSPIAVEVSQKAPVSAAPAASKSKPAENKSRVTVSAPAMSIEAPGFKTSKPEKSKRKYGFLNALIGALLALAVGISVYFLYPYIHNMSCNLASPSEAPLPSQDVNIESIKINTLPDKTCYKTGEYLDTTGMTLELTYSDGTTEIVDSGFECSPSAFTQAGTTTINVSYDGYEGLFFDVEVIEIMEVRLASLPEQTTYVAGEYLDTHGLILEVLYTNGTRKIVTDDYYCWPEGLFKEGTVEISVFYEAMGTSFPVEVLGTAEQNESEFSFEGLTMDMGLHAHDSTGVGINANGEYLNYNLIIAINLPKSIEDRYAETIACSWDHVYNGSGGYEKTFTFMDGKNPGTFAEYGVMEPENGDTENNIFFFNLILPDDPSIEGPQFVTIGAGGSRKTITFDLIYLGNYETGLGWSVTNICYD